MHPKVQLQQDLKDAMRAKDELRKSVIRMTISALKNAEIDACGELDEDAAIKVMVAEAKRRRDSIADYEKAGRDDLVEQEKAELAVLEGYLPEQLGKEEIAAQAKAVIAEVGASSMKDMGNVMKALMPRLGGRADGRLVNQVVRELLT
jgi:uncharacterized protein